jgi:hypothetical protein
MLRLSSTQVETLRRARDSRISRMDTVRDGYHYVNLPRGASGKTVKHLLDLGLLELTGELTGLGTEPYRPTEAGLLELKERKK